MSQRLRISRAAVFGAVTGAIFAGIGELRAPDVPPGVVAWAYVAGGWAGSILLGIAVFVAIAAIFNSLVGMTEP